MKKISVFAVLILLLFSLFLFAACDEEDSEVYCAVAGYSYDNKTDTVTVQIKLQTSSENAVTKVEYKRSKTDDGFFDIYKTTYAMPSDFWDKIRQYASVDESLGKILDENGVDREYSLKIVYVYATLYKSIYGDGEYAENGKTRMYIWQFADGDDAVMTLTQRTEDRAAWYGLLIGIFALATVIVSAVAIAKRKGDKNERTKDSNE